MLQAALAANLARVRATSYVGAPAPGGPCVMRIKDEEFRLDAVVVIGEPGSSQAAGLLCDAIQGALIDLLATWGGPSAHEQHWVR